MAVYYEYKIDDHKHIYETVEKWKEQCLINDKSLLWEDEAIWTSENIERFRFMFIENPDETDLSFEEKIKKQLSGEPKSVYKFVIELLYIYYLFPNKIKFETKKEKLKEIASWKDIYIDESTQTIQSLKNGIGAIGTFYMTSKYHELSFLFYVCEYIKKQPVEDRISLLNSAVNLKKTIEKIREELIQKKVQMQNILLHLIIPDKFERISSWAHKTNIVTAFDSMLYEEESSDIDEQLWVIREKLSVKYGESFDFYKPEIYNQWNPKKEKEPDKQNIKVSLESSQNLEATNQEALHTSLFFEHMDLLKERIITAIHDGKHIILMGPPGTGKSKLASKIAEMFQLSSVMTTASSNWSTYETIGGYRLNKDGNLYFNPGIFLDCVKNKQTKQSQNEWLIIDEINRADIDKAFGSLFSVLAGDQVTLPFEENNGKSIILKPEDNTTEIKQEDNTFVFPKQWRIIATMNTSDKASLYEMSYAFMRRFAFIPVTVPKNITSELVSTYINIWGMERYPNREMLASIWKIINDYRKVGPAIIEDIAKYTEDKDDFASAIMLYVLPQLEGIPIKQVQRCVERLVNETDANMEYGQFSDYIEDFFGSGMFDSI